MEGENKPFWASAGLYLGRPTWNELNKVLGDGGRVVGLEGDRWREVEFLGTKGWLGLKQMPTTNTDPETRDGGVWHVEVLMPDADYARAMADVLRARMARDEFDIVGRMAEFRKAKEASHG
jgi:hypothetical protein